MLHSVDWVYWMLNNQWVFWLLVNVGVYIVYTILLASEVVGVYGLILPIGVGVATIILGEPWWVGFISFGFILLAILPVVFAKSDP